MEPTKKPLMHTIRDRLRGFHQDEGGQTIVYLALMMFLLACFTFMVINSGNLLHDKMQAQSAADAAVMSGATWVVRAMNLNSMMNIILAMLLAEEIYMKAVFWTALTAVLLSPIIEAFWAGVCLTTGTCNPAIDVVFDTFDLFPVMWETEDDEDFIWDIMETISDTEEGVNNVMPWVAEIESVRVAMMDGAAFGVMYPPTIPEEQGELQDLCECTLSGAEGGYNEGQYNMLSWGAEALGDIVGTMSGFDYASDIRNMASNLLSAVGLGGPLWGEMQLPYHAFWVQKAPYHFTNVMFILAVMARYAVMCGGSFGPSSLSYEIGAAWWCFFCDDNNISIPNPFYYLGELFSFLDAGNPNVQPFMLAEDWESRKNYYGFAYKTPEDIQSRFIPNVFQNSLGDTMGMVTIAQAQIYNPHEGGELFSPHWRVHLAPVSLGSDVIDGATSFIPGSQGAGEASGEGVSGMITSLAGLAGSGLDAIFAH